MLTRPLTLPRHTPIVSAMVPRDLRVLLFPETGGLWAARALEHDVAVQARSADNALDAVIKIIRAHVEFDRRHNRSPLSAFGPAPRIYWTAFRVASQAAVAREVEIDETTPRFLVAIAEHAPEVFRLSRTA